MYGLKGGAVAIPSWILIFRFAQLFFAILALAMCAYSLSVHGGGPLQPPLIATIIISGLTLVPILLLTTPLHIAQRRMYDPRIALLLDGFAAMYWLATFAAMASYQRIFRNWGVRFDRFFFQEAAFCWNCRKAWRTGVAATVFAAVEFVLFTLSTLAVLYYYHFHTAGIPASGTHHNEEAMAEKNGPNGAAAATGAAHPGGNVYPAGAPYEHSGGYAPGGQGTQQALGPEPFHVEPPMAPSKREEGEVGDIPTRTVGAGGDRCGG